VGQNLPWDARDGGFVEVQLAELRDEPLGKVVQMTGVGVKLSELFETEQRREVRDLGGRAVEGLEGLEVGERREVRDLGVRAVE
jgi:hypothetical protein